MAPIAADLILEFLKKAGASLGSRRSLVDQGGNGQPVLPFLTHMNQVGQTASTPRHQKGLSSCCHGEEPHVVGRRFIGDRRAISLEPNCRWTRGKADLAYIADASKSWLRGMNCSTCCCACDLNHRQNEAVPGYLIRERVYTVSVGNKTAWTMLALALLWAALPALACASPAPQHACCHHMMQDCGPSMATPSCCNARPSGAAVPPAQASQAQRDVVVAHLSVVSRIAAPAADGFAPIRAAETPPGSVASLHSTVLRI